MQENEASVPIGTGQKLRNLQVTVINDTTMLPETVLMEVVSISDAAGNVINEFMDYNYERQMLTLMKTVVLLLYNIAGSTDDNVDLTTMMQG